MSLQEEITQTYSGGAELWFNELNVLDASTN